MTAPQAHYSAQGSVPFDRVIWDAEDCANYLKVEKMTFLKRTQYAEGFPDRLPIPGKPRWRAAAVTQWALGESRQYPAKAA